MKVWKPAEDDGNFEMTPMIDIVFLLITFFMTVTSYASAELIPISMPNATEAKVPDEAGNRQFLSVQAVEVKGERTGEYKYYLGAFPSNLEDIKNQLMRRSLEKDFKGAYIRADSHTPHRYVDQLMKTCAEAGVYNILFGTLKD